MNMFNMASDSTHEYSETVSDYISWCTSICIPYRSVCVLPNQKPWFNAEVRVQIRNKCDAFKSGGKEEYTWVQYELH